MKTKLKELERYKRSLLKTLREELKRYDVEHSAHIKSAGDKYARGSCALCNMYQQTQSMLKQTIDLIKTGSFDHRIIE